MSGATSKPPSRAVWAARLILLFIVVTAVGVAVFLLYFRWRAAAYNAQVRVEGGNPALSLPESLYLQAYLITNAEELAQPAGNIGAPSRFVIDSGEPAGAVASRLEEAGLLRDRELFLNYIRYYGLDSQLEAGAFSLDPAMPIPALAQQLTEANANEITLRFLEGWRAEEMATYLATTTPARIDADRFLGLAQGRIPHAFQTGAFLAELPAGASLEGYLFPDTYRVPLDATAEDLLEMMLANFDERVAPLRPGFSAQGLSLHEAVTLASIVERETPLPEERPLVAGVFLNRLAVPMRLQADPTVQYALGFAPGESTWWKSGLTSADLQIDSPYNTYVVEGLPPGPIASPGLASLQAVAQPQASDFLYFVADCGQPGAHTFAVTYEEHLQNVERCR